VLNFRKQKMNEKLHEAVIELHNVARLIEETIGRGQLSEDVRRCADRLNVLINPVKDN